MEVNHSANFIVSSFDLVNRCANGTVLCTLICYFVQVNMSEKDYVEENNKYLPKIQGWYYFYSKSNCYNKTIEELML